MSGIRRLNSTLVENRPAFFPDAVTARGKNHLVELQKLAGAGLRPVVTPHSGTGKSYVISGMLSG